MSAGCGENDFRHQVVAVGTPLPTTSMLATQQGPVMLTAKNLQCMRAMLHLAHCHGCILGTSWHIVLATLQHLVWILGLKPSTGGSLQVVPKLSTDATAGITTSVMADLPVLSQMLSQLFESSQYLDDVALHHLIDALCKLSQEAMELAYSNRVCVLQKVCDKYSVLILYLDLQFVFVGLKPGAIIVCGSKIT